MDKTNGKNVYYVNDPKNGKAGDFEYNGRGATYDYNNANYTIIGNAVPKVYGGINTTTTFGRQTIRTVQSPVSKV